MANRMAMYLMTGKNSLIKFSRSWLFSESFVGSAALGFSGAVVTAPRFIRYPSVTVRVAAKADGPNN